MIIGLIVIGELLGAGAAIVALLLGYSIWAAFLLYVATGTASVLILAVSVALRPDPQGRASAAEPYARSACGGVASGIPEFEAPSSAIRSPRERTANSVTAS